MFVKSTTCGKIEAARNGVTSTAPSLTESTLVEVNMAKKYYTLPLSFCPTTSPRLENLTGKTFARLTVLGYVGKRYWFCQCVCKNIVKVASYYLKDGQVKSCGCLVSEVIKKLHTTHGKTRTKVYRAWAHIKTRCFNKNSPSYKDYGGRGITMCERWKTSFENFYADMGEPPTPKHQIDRKNNNGHYEPSNCHWTTCRQNNNNRRSNKKFTYNGQTKTYAQWCRVFNITQQQFYDRRVRRGQSIKQALGIL